MNPEPSDVLEHRAGEQVPGKWEAFTRMLRYLRVRKVMFIAVSLFMLLGSVSFVLLSVYLGIAVNALTGAAAASEIQQIGIEMIVFALGTFICYLLGFWLLADVTQAALFTMRQELFEHVQTLSLRFYDRQPIGELMSRVMNDIDVITGFFQQPLGILIMGFFMLLATLVTMFSLNDSLAIVASLTIPLLAGLVYLLSRVAGPAFTLLQERLSALNGLMEETLAGEKTIIAYGRQRTMAGRQEEISEEAHDVGSRAQVLSLMLNPLIMLVTLTDLALVALVGSLMIIEEAISVGVLTTFLSLTLLFVLPLSSIFANYNFVLSAVVSAGRIFSIMDEEPGIRDKPDATELKPVEGHVVFKDVTFSYVPGRQVLRKNSFEAFPGEMIGLCGPTGAGKSTIINILTRYYDIDCGSIEIDDQSIYDVTRTSLRRQIGVVLQEPFLFSDTVMNNIRYGRADATDEECIAAARESSCDEFISRLPDGYQTILSDGGSNLSQGQRQLLTIARAMVADPRVLILDEATSSVDTRTEKKIQAALQKLQQGRTSFVIAHRLSTIRNANQILVIDDGEIKEKGTHDVLMGMKGFYYDLYMSQFKGRIADILP
jgi:ATP-binding cassette subfamily B protein